MQCSMQHIPFHSALLAKNTIFDPKKHFFPQSTPEKVRKSQQILKMWRNSICLGWKFLSESKLFVEGNWQFLAICNFCHPAKRIFLPQYIVSSVRSSNSHPDLLLTQHHHQPLFQITPVLNTGLSLSEPLQLYKCYNAIKRQNLERLWHTPAYSGIL